MDTPKMTLEQFECEFKKGIGKEIDLNGQNFIVEASRDNIRNFAEAVGDNNPLWTNEEYALKSRYGMITAPPTFLYSINHGSTPALTPPGMPVISNLRLLYAGAELEFTRPIRLDEQFNVTGKSIDITRKVSQSLGPMLFTTGEACYYNKENEKLGHIHTTICRFNPPKEQAVHIDRKPRPGIEPKSPDHLAFDRVRRGAGPRFWEDIEIGMEMTPILEKGLLTMMEIIRFGLFVAGMPRRIEQRRPYVEIGFSREEMQKSSGLESASDYGPQRVCWLSQFVTDWIGDEGTFKKMSCQVRHPSIIGDINFVKGKVKEKYVRDGEHLVELEIRVENQAGLVTAPGEAIVALPSKK